MNATPNGETGQQIMKRYDPICIFTSMLIRICWSHYLTPESLGRKVCLKQVVRIAWIQLLRMQLRLEFFWKVWDLGWPGPMVNLLPKHFAWFSWLISRTTLLSAFQNSLYGPIGAQNSQRSERRKVTNWSKSVGFCGSASSRVAQGSSRTIYPIPWVFLHSSIPAVLC